MVLGAILVTPTITRCPPQRHIRTRAHLAAIKEALTLFRRACGRYPATEVGLGALLATASDRPCNDFPAEGYLKRVPLDAWGQPYVYTSDGVRFSVTSYGADGEPGGEDLAADIEVVSDVVNSAG